MKWIAWLTTTSGPDIKASLGGLEVELKQCPLRNKRRPGACRTWGVESENRPQRGQFLLDLQAHSPAMGQNEVSVETNLYSSYVATKKTVGAKCGVAKKWTAAVDLQPTILKSDRLLASPSFVAKPQNQTLESA